MRESSTAILGLKLLEEREVDFVIFTAFELFEHINELVAVDQLDFWITIA